MSERQSKSTQDKHERMLNEIVKNPGNEKCADCGSRSKIKDLNKSEMKGVNMS